MIETSDTSMRPLRTRPGQDSRPGWAAGVIAAVVAALLGLLVCGGLTVVVWLAGESGTAGGALRGGAIAWLAAHGSGVTVGHTVINAIPLGLFALVVLTLHATVARVAAGWGVSSRIREVGVVAATCAASYAAVLAVVAWWSQLEVAAVHPGRAAIAGLVVGGVCGATGAAHGTGWLRRHHRALPPTARSALRGGIVGAITLVSTAGLLVVGDLVVRADAAGALWDGLRPGLLGGIGLLLVCVLVLPNLVLWTVAAMLGPGYALGAGTSVTLTSSTLGLVPALPVLAAVPPAGPRPGWLIAFAAVPLLAGALAGYVTVTRAERRALGAFRTDVVAGAAAGAFAGAVVGVGLLLSGGAVGPGRLGHSGPDLPLSVLLSIGVLAVGGAVGAAAAHYRSRRGADDDALFDPSTADSTPHG
ncbi:MULTISPECIES: DUF6350 family protein [Mumia]|uniref:cell division protein PerM n=1 Tax=Mumia TaxID=1546255 RepID=UPI001C711A02|nr:MULTISPECIES: DUF6350 family protein [unclassified Mumia]